MSFPKFITRKNTLLTLSAALLLSVFTAHRSIPALNTKEGIITGADQVDAYLPLLKGKRVGMMVNLTSIIGNKLSVDSLKARGVDIKLVFGPEHGFRANASNGAEVADEVDPKTGIPIISLYGNRKKPSKAEMDKLDVIIYDFQDVGCRFYTNINALRDIMEACAEYDKPLIILDRPNPNPYVDGPILDMQFKSGIGQFPVPVTHGMTIGEFARMIKGEGWMTNANKSNIIVIPVKNYTHEMEYTLPVGPSPNLSSQQAVLLYPSLCLFEGTYISQGRGTEMPFTVLGAPELKGVYNFSFKPVSIPGKSENPLHKNQVCYGLDLRNYDTKPWRKKGQINIGWMIEMYKALPQKEKFFDSSFSTSMGIIERLIGVKEFRQQIINGVSEADIRKSWEPGLSNYKKMRVKYLLYP